MKATFFGIGIFPPPPSSPHIFPHRYGAGARGAADAGVELVVQAGDPGACRLSSGAAIIRTWLL